MENLTPLVVDVDCDMQLSAVSALTVGMVMMGSGDGDIASAIVAAMEERMKLASQVGVAGRSVGV